MKKLFIFCLSLSLWACSSAPREEKNISIIQKINLNQIEEIFKSHGVEGCFILHDYHQNVSTVYNEARSKKVFSPASTYKIPHSLIALETKAVHNRYQIIPWDGQERAFKKWNQDHNLESALKVSAVWFYQEIARRVGTERMQTWVDTLQYGNQDISGGIDQFWLTGGLRISPQEQLEFLKNFYEETFPCSPENFKTVKEILVKKKSDTYTIRGKTGWWLNQGQGSDIGWYVGYVEAGEDVLFFVINIDIQKNEDAQARYDILHDTLKELEIMTLLEN